MPRCLPERFLLHRTGLNNYERKLMSGLRLIRASHGRDAVKTAEAGPSTLSHDVRFKQENYKAMHSFIYY